MEPTEFTRVFVSKSTRAWLHKLKGPEKSYDAFIQELCIEYESRSPPPSYETGNEHNGCEQ